MNTNFLKETLYIFKLFIFFLKELYALINNSSYSKMLFFMILATTCS